MPNAVLKLIESITIIFIKMVLSLWKLRKQPPSFKSFTLFLKQFKFWITILFEFSISMFWRLTEFFQNVMFFTIIEFVMFWKKKKLSKQKH